MGPRLTPPSPTPQATTFPTPSERPLPIPPTPSPPSSTPPPLDARTTPALWCLALMVVSLELSLLPLLLLLSPLLRKAGRRGRRPPRLTLRLPLRLIPGCSTVATDSPTVGTTATATTTLPTLTSEAAATTSADLSLALEDRREASYQRKIKIDSWNHVLISCFTFVQRVCQNIEIDNRKTLK